ncbi:MAG: hypothetical protein R3F61_10625 [Myxococcota bacterium]
MLAMLATALASEPVWAGLAERQLAHFCATDRIFVGTLSSATSFPTPGHHDAPIHTTLVFAVERNLVGSGASFMWTMPGGRLQNVVLDGELEPLVVVDGQGMPEGKVGRRYLMALTTLKQDVGPRKKGEQRHTASFSMDADASLPSQAELQSAFRTSCATL